MESYHFISIDDVSVSQIEYVFKKMLEKEESKYCNFNRDNYEWRVGQQVFRTLRRLSYIYDFGLDWELHKFLDVDMIVNSLDYETMDVHLVKKENIDCSYSIFFDSCKYKYLNEKYGIIEGKDEKNMRQEVLSSEYITSTTFGIPCTRSYVDTDTAARNVAYDQMRGLVRKRFIKNVIYNDPATIVFWSDGTKTVVKAEDEPFDPEKGLAMAIAKKHFGNEGNYYDIFREWLPKEESIDDGLLSDLFLGKSNPTDTKQNAYTVKEYCNKYHCSRKKVYDMIKYHVLVAYKNSKGMWMIYDE